MLIAEIINEIDAYLSRLCQARELLLDRRTEAPQKRVPRRRGKVMVGQADMVSSSRRRADKNKFGSSDLVTHPKEGKGRGYPAAQVSSAVPRHLLYSEQTAIVESKITQPSVVISRLPAKGPITSIRSVRHRTAKPAFANMPDVIKPAIALAGPMNTKIVVVSAEQLLRERERAARLQPRPQRTPITGLSGRRAFDALFKNESDPSKTSGE